jgi:hypothetical protein
MGTMNLATRRFGGCHQSFSPAPVLLSRAGRRRRTRLADAGTIQGAGNTEGNEFACEPSPDASLVHFQPPDASRGARRERRRLLELRPVRLHGAGTLAPGIAAATRPSSRGSVPRRQHGNPADVPSSVVGASGIAGFLGGGGSGIDSPLMGIAACIMASGCLDACGAAGFWPSGDGRADLGGSARRSTAAPMGRAMPPSTARPAWEPRPRMRQLDTHFKIPFTPSALRVGPDFGAPLG